MQVYGISFGGWGEKLYLCTIKINVEPLNNYGSEEDLHSPGIGPDGADAAGPDLVRV